MRGPYFIIALVAVVIAIAGGVAAAMFPGWWSRNTPYLQDTESGAVAKFTDQCTVFLMRQSTGEDSNTQAQMESTCRCMGAELYQHIKDMSIAEALDFQRLPIARERVNAATTKCAHRNGLDVFEGAND